MPKTFESLEVWRDEFLIQAKCACIFIDVSADKQRFATARQVLVSRLKGGAVMRLIFLISWGGMISGSWIFWGDPDNFPFVVLGNKAHLIWFCFAWWFVLPLLHICRFWFYNLPSRLISRASARLWLQMTDSCCAAFQSGSAGFTDGTTLALCDVVGRLPEQKPHSGASRKTAYRAPSPSERFLVSNFYK